MLPIQIVPVVVPLLQIASFAYLIGVQAIDGILQGCLIGEVDVKSFSSLDGVSEELAYDGEVGCSTIEGTTLIAFICDVLSLWRGAGAVMSSPGFRGLSISHFSMKSAAPFISG